MKSNTYNKIECFQKGYKDFLYEDFKNLFIFFSLIMTLSFEMFKNVNMA